MRYAVLAILLSACGGQESTVLVPNTLTYDGHTVTWKQIPISVIHTDEVPCHTRVAIEQSMRNLNTLAGCEIFSTQLGSPTIETRSSPGTGGRWVGEWDDDGHFTKAHIRIGVASDIPVLISTHELMHALGFAHSTDPMNIMHPYVDEDATISEEQILSIQILYCGGQNG